MRRLILLSAFFVLGALVFDPVTARAGLHFCNKTAGTISIAVATETLYDYRVWGWWQVASDNCREPIGDDLNTTGDTRYFYYAFNSAGQSWSGNTPFCLDLVNAFDYNSESDCTTGTRRQFKEIDTKSATDFTLNLTP